MSRCQGVIPERRSLAQAADQTKPASSRATLAAISIGNAGPAYFLTARGANALAEYHGDDAWLETNTQPPPHGSPAALARHR